MPTFDSITLVGGFTFSIPVQDFFVLKDWSDMSSPQGQNTIYKPIYDSTSNIYYSPSITGIMYTSDTSASTWAIKNKGVLTGNVRTPMNSIAYNGSNRFVACLNGTVATGNITRSLLYSDNAVDWNVANMSTNLSGQFGVIWTGSRFVCRGIDSNQFDANIVLNSVDGITWNSSGPNSVLAKFENYMPSTNGTNIVVFRSNSQGGIVSNNGGTTFNSFSFPSTGTSLRGQMCFAEGAFFESRGNAILYSTNGITWTNAGNIFPANSEVDFNSAATNGTIVVATQSNGKVLTTSASSFPNIPANVKWTSVDTGTNRDLFGIIYDGSKFVVNGENGVILTSTDGINWNIRKQAEIIAANVMGTSGFFSGISNGNTVIMTIRQDNAPIQFFNSDNGGITWTFSNVPGNNFIRDFAFDGNNYLGVSGTNILYKSSNGVTWNTSTIGGSSSTDFQKIAYGPNSTNKYIATSIGNSTGTAWTSTDSNTWVQRGSIMTAFTAQDLIYDGNRYIFLGSVFGSFSVSSSTEGITWTPARSVFSATSGTVAAITFNAGTYVVVGGANGATGNGTIVTSSDLNTWTFRESNVIGDLQSVSYNTSLSKFVAVGSGGSITTSENGVEWTNRSSTQTTSMFKLISEDCIFSDTNLVRLLVN